MMQVVALTGTATETFVASFKVSLLILLAGPKKSTINVTTVVWIGAKFRTRDIWNMIQEFWPLRRKAQCLSEYWVQLTLRNKWNRGWEKHVRQGVVTDGMYRYGERRQWAGGGGGWDFSRGWWSIPALAAIPSAFGAYAPFLSVDRTGCLLP